MWVRAQPTTAVPMTNRWCQTLETRHYSSFCFLTATSQRAFAERLGIPRHLLLNALNGSELLSEADVAAFDFGTEKLHWKLLSLGELCSGRVHLAS